MPEAISAKLLLARHVKRKDRVLLLNPYVEETRYSWLRWNQPLDLLKIGGHLRKTVGCHVDLLDLMKPDREGEVPEEWLPGAQRYRTIGGERYPMRRFGLPGDREITNWVNKRRAEDAKGLPTQVWITSLCSYWSGTVDRLCGVIRSLLPDAVIVLIGNYPRLAADHASEVSIADYMVTEAISLKQQEADLTLYGNEMPSFLGLSLEPKTAIAEVKSAVSKGVLHFTFFEDDIGKNDGEPFLEIVKTVRQLKLHRHLRFHVTCGLYPEGVTPQMAELLADPKLFAALNFEETDTDGELDLDAYHRCRSSLVEHGLKLPDSRLSGFVWMGRPGDEIDQLVLKSFQVLDCFGSLVLKPYTPVTSDPRHRKHKKYLSAIRQQADFSPHFFPFAEFNGITHAEYHDLYRLAAFLNEKIRGRSFDFLADTIGADFLRSSLNREVWKLEPSPLRVINQSADL